MGNSKVITNTMGLRINFLISRLNIAQNRISIEFSVIRDQLSARPYLISITTLQLVSKLIADRWPLLADGCFLLNSLGHTRTNDPGYLAGFFFPNGTARIMDKDIF